MGQEEVTERVLLDVEGMSCDHCIDKVKGALVAIEGVAGADVSIESGLATVEGENLAEDVLTRAVSEAGYEASVHIGS